MPKEGEKLIAVLSYI